MNITHVEVRGLTAVLHEITIKRLGDQLVAPVRVETRGHNRVEGGPWVADHHALEVHFWVVSSSVAVHNLLRQLRHVVTTVGLGRDVQLRGK